MAADTYWSESAADVSSHFVGGVEALTIKEATNIVVGIQTENLATWTSTVSALQVGGTAGLSSTTTQAGATYSWLSSNAYHDRGTNTWKYLSTNADDQSSLIQMVNGLTTFKTAITGTAGADITWITQLELQNNTSGLSATFGGDIIVPQGNKVSLNAGGDTYITEFVDNQMRLTVAGTDRVKIDGDGFGGITAGEPLIRARTVATATTPVYSIVGSTGYGLGGAPASGYVSMTANSVEGQRWVEDTWGVSSHFPEITTPTAIASYWSIYGKADNLFYFQDGAGVEHTVLLDSTSQAYSSMWFNGVPTTQTITTQNAFTKITTFVNVGYEDPSLNVVGDATTDDDFTIALAGIYRMNLQATITNAGGGNVEFLLGSKIALATPITITDATNATPIVITTAAAHGLQTGDGVVISNVGGNTNANGDFLITVLTSTTFELNDTDWTNIAGSGAYTSGGTIDSICPGNIVMARIVSNTEKGRGACSGDYSLAVGDIVTAYAVNRDGTDNLSMTQIQHSVDFKG
jgi:hypothetical protein